MMNNGYLNIIMLDIRINNKRHFFRVNNDIGNGYIILMLKQWLWLFCMILVHNVY